MVASYLGIVCLLLLQAVVLIRIMRRVRQADRTHGVAQRRKLLKMWTAGSTTAAGRPFIEAEVGP